MSALPSIKARPVHSEADGIKMPKKRCGQSVFPSGSDFDVDDPFTHIRRPMKGASPLRSASSIGFSHVNSFDVEPSRSRENTSFRSTVGILSSTQLRNYHALNESSKHPASGIMDLARPTGQQRLVPGQDSFLIDVSLIQPGCEEAIKRSRVSNMPFAEIEAIKHAKRFMSVKEFEEAHENEQEESACQFRRQLENVESTPERFCIPNPNIDPAEDDSSKPASFSHGENKPPKPRAEIVLADPAVIEISGVKDHGNQAGSVSDNKMTDDLNKILEKLRLANVEYRVCKEAGIHIPLGEPLQSSRQVSHSKEPSTQSDDSGVDIKKQAKDSKSLNPTAAEFVVRPTPIRDSAIIQQSVRGNVQRSPDADAPKDATTIREKALADAIDNIANYSQGSLENLQEVVQNTIQQFSIPGMGLPSLVGSSCPPPPPLLSMPPCGPDMTSGPPNLPPPSLGFSPVDFLPTPAPGLAPIPFGLNGPPMPVGALGPMVPHPPPSGYTGPLPMPPPPGYGPGGGFGPGPFGPKFDFDFLLGPGQYHQTPAWAPQMGHPAVNSQAAGPPGVHAVCKPRGPDAFGQQAYEAHIEWRKANEPGYAQKCKERQKRRAAKVSQ